MTVRAQTPNDSLGTCAAWADCTDGTTQTAAGSSKISAIASKSAGSSFSWSNTDSSKFPAIVANAIGSKSALSFNGLQKLLSPAIAVPATYTIVAVVTTTTLSSATGAVFDSDNRGSQRLGQFLRFVQAQMQSIPFNTGGSAFVLSSSNIAANTAYVVRIVRTATSITIWINGTLIATLATSGTPISATALTSIGQNLADDGGHQGLIGWISLNSVTDSDSGYRLEAIAAEPFGLRSTFPSNHPFYSAAPTYDDGTGAASAVPAPAAQTIASSSPTLSSRSVTTLDSGAMQPAITQPPLAARSSLAPDAATTGQSAGSPSLAARAVAAPDPAAQGHAAGSPSLNVRSSAAPDGAVLAQISTAPTTAARSSATPDAIAQGSMTTAPIAAARSAVAPDGGVMPQPSSVPSLATKGAAQPDDSTNGQAASPPVVAVRSAAVPDSLTTAQTAAVPQVLARSIVAPDSAALVHALSSAALSVAGAANPDGGALYHRVGMPTLSGVRSVVAVDSAVQALTAAQPALAASSSVLVASAYHGHLSSAPALAPRAAVSPGASLHGHVAASPVITSRILAWPSSGAHQQLVLAPAIAITGPVASVDSAVQGVVLSEPYWSFPGSIAVGWAVRTKPRLFVGVIAHRSFDIAIGGPRKMNFPSKFPFEVRNASVDFTAALAAGETLVDVPTVEMVAGDVSISNRSRDGAVVYFTLSGGTRGGGVFQTVAIECGTSSGQVIGETAALTILP